MKKVRSDESVIPHPVWRQLAYLNRWQIVRCDLPRSVATHCFFVVHYVEHLIRCVKLDAEESLLLIRAALNHDLAEAITGDVPTPVKRAMKWDDKIADVFAERLTGSKIRVDLPAHLNWFLKLCDQLEAVVHLISERNHGNASVATPLNELRAFLFEFMREPTEEATESWISRYNTNFPRINWWVADVLRHEENWTGLSFKLEERNESQPS